MQNIVFIGENHIQQKNQASIVTSRFNLEIMPSGVMQCAVFTFVAVACRASDRSYRERHVKWHTVCLCFISGTRRCVLEQQGDLATETEASAGIPKTQCLNFLRHSRILRHYACLMITYQRQCCHCVNRLRGLVARRLLCCLTILTRTCVPQISRAFSQSPKHRWRSLMRFMSILSCHPSSSVLQVRCSLTPVYLTQVGKGQVSTL